MILFSKRFFPIALILIASAALIPLLLVRQSPARRQPDPRPTARIPAPQPPEPSPALSMLAAQPDWQALEVYQKTITRSDFETLLTTIFTTGEAWKTCITLTDHEALIKMDGSPEGEVFRLSFASPGEEIQASRHWRTTAELPPATAEKPLAGLKIAIDAGHIGGEWAKMEERWFTLGTGTPVMEGDMTLFVAKLLKPRLEAMGATISLVREKLEPVTPLRPDALQSLARDSGSPPDSPAALQKLAERLFYRTAEIRSRAELVNKTLKPDLVLCLHFNAEAWGNPLQPTLIDRTHLHLILNGAYNDEEVLLADQRFALLQKLLQRTHQEEVLVGSTVANTFAQISGLPAYTYLPENRNVRGVPGQPYLWIRNLLANRLYDCPVIFMEPYVMNSTIDYARIQAGDYDGYKEIQGRFRPSIFREYADALCAGLVKHYSSRPKVAE
ncbi:N-acetylmuramoyl-L-alanine amidase [Luteolibacter yonseiensis]|uniref:N-acetylmuramoyl-L-alanine amidase n=1 Tax=Luteolibacter yonseiensis TaxID=1144680 RepID=A0A934R363_9BACT|nr:N-acetylmuramoyl-L-alanine amidase [Luteolibacter yonseiensis]MBK1816029.1 N-acetylmuramoyl-L-alanine amidase [Luteolibacter yonseiensis]